jgi:type IV secretion system protein VirB10
MVSLSRPASGGAPTNAPASLGDLLEATEQLARFAQAPPPGTPAAAVASPAVLSPDRTVAPTQLAATGSVSALTLAAGSLIPAVLTSTVNSDTPGSVTAVVSHDVFDSLTGRSLLIPAGSRLLGSSGAASQGQNRLEIVWSRLNLPDGTTYQLGAMPAADPAGAAGLQDRTNRHLVRTFGAALLLSAFSAGAQLSQPDAYSGTLRTPSAQEVAAGALGQQVNATAGALIDRELRVPPTLVLRSGMGCNVVVTADLVFPGTYGR